MRLTKAFLALGVSLMFLSGCASIVARTQGRANHVYPGVREDIHYMVHPNDADLPFLQFLNILDLPFSAVLDTLFLPFDMYRLRARSAKLGDSCKNQDSSGR